MEFSQVQTSLELIDWLRKTLQELVEEPHKEAVVNALGGGLPGLLRRQNKSDIKEVLNTSENLTQMNVDQKHLIANAIYNAIHGETAAGGATSSGQQ
eukprot:2726427-Amphidinium_carterae.1